MTTASGVSTVEPRIFEGTRQTTIAAHGLIDVLSSQPFLIHVTNFSVKAMQLPKHMVVAYATGHPRIVITVSSTSFHHSQKGAPKNVNRANLSNLHLVPCEATITTTRGKAQQTKKPTKDRQHLHVDAVPCNPNMNRESQIQNQTCIQSNGIEQPTKDWQDEVVISAPYHT